MTDVDRLGRLAQPGPFPREVDGPRNDLVPDLRPRSARLELFRVQFLFACRHHLLSTPRRPPPRLQRRLTLHHPLQDLLE